MLRFAPDTSAVGTLAIEGEPPCRAHEPRTEAVTLPQAPEVPMRLDERLLRHILRILSLAPDPRTEPVTLPQAPEVPMGLDERLLRHNLRILSPPKHPVRHTERKG